MNKNTHLFVIIVFSFLLSAGEYFGQSNQPTLQYFGNAFVKLTTVAGKVIYIDPYAVNVPDSADIILVTHEHDCHNDLTKVLPKKGCATIRPANGLIGGAYQNFTIGEIKISAKPAYNKYHLKEEGVGYLLEFDGIKVYHAGGTAKIPEMTDLTNEKIDYALYPLTPGPEEMTQAAVVVNAKHDIPIHSLVSLERQINQGLINRFTSPNKLVLANDQIITMVHEDATEFGRIINVPQDYPTIQTAINAAQNGDTVLVAEGVYYENIRFNGKGIVVASKFIFSKDWQTVINTIIDGSKRTNKDTASTVQFLDKEDSTAVLEGFTITGGTGTKYMFPNGNGNSPWQEGAGIVMHNSSAIVRNNYITNNTTVPQPGVTNGGGGGIASMYGHPTIYNNVIVSNIAGYAGGIVLNWSGGRIYNNIVYHNKSGGAYGTGGVMIWLSSTNTVVENNTIIGNISQKDAGGININSTIPSVRNNIVWANRQVSGKQVSNPQRGSYNNMEDYSDATNISVFPAFIENSFLLNENSPCIDAGDPSIDFNDNEDVSVPGKAQPPAKGNLRNDIGAFGGNLAEALSHIELYDLYVPASTINLLTLTSKEGSRKFELLNLSTNKVRIDSVVGTNKLVFSVSSKLIDQSDPGNSFLGSLCNDTIAINYRPTVTGAYSDTVKIFHNAPGVTNPVKVVVKLSATITDVLEEVNIPGEFKLYQNYPNPFNPTTEINFNIAKRSNVSIKIFDILGREVENLISKELEPGKHSITWNPKRNLTSGVYFVNLIAENLHDSKKMIYQK